MAAAQLLCSGLELVINKVLALDEQRLAGLSGKSCEVLPIELGFAIKFIFDRDKIMVCAPENEVDTQNLDTLPTSAARKPSLSDDECKIKLSIFAIPELQDMSNLTRLIREEKLDFEGNLSIAQKFGDLFKQLDLDLEEELSKYVGDIAAHSFAEHLKNLHQTMKGKGKLAVNTFADALLDEKPVAVRGIIVENFNQEVSDLRKTYDRVEARLTRLEVLDKQADIKDKQ